MRGFVKLHRALADWYGANCPKRLALWVHLLILASHKETSFVLNGTIIQIKPGQLVTGRKKLSALTGIPESTVRRLLLEFKKYGQIGLTVDRHFSLITLTNWAQYQEIWTSGGHIQECKEFNNSKSINKDTLNSSVKQPRNFARTDKSSKRTTPNPSSTREAFEGVWRLYPRKEGKERAWKSYRRTVKTEKDLEAIKGALQNYILWTEHEYGANKDKYTKHGATWFNEWQDEKWHTPPMYKQPLKDTHVPDIEEIIKRDYGV